MSSLGKHKQKGIPKNAVIAVTEVHTSVNLTAKYLQMPITSIGRRMKNCLVRQVLY